MRLKMLRQVYFIVIVLIVACFYSAGIFAATSDKDFTLDDSSGDSPQIILRDQDDKDLTLQKLDSGEAVVVYILRPTKCIG